ncbi:MAG TPA: FAD-dependent oxidoreductase [Rectinemataceae bacterium]|nr:FAD-dependent oxidoreductase [Rectinemataceae bacterium]
MAQTLRQFSEIDPAPANGKRVCIIGGGGTGAALAYDLGLRGFAVTLVEKGELTSGTTGRHHGQLHCGARYALADRQIARECMEESALLGRMVPEAMEYNGGLFVELDEEDHALETRFIDACRESGIPARRLTPGEALAREGTLSPSILGAVHVPDGSFDAFRLPLAFFAAARHLGARILPWTEVVDLERSSGRITVAVVRSRNGGTIVEDRIEAEYFVSATGAWAGLVGRLAGLDVPISPAPGTMVAVKGRLCDHVVSHLHPAGDGDIIVPQRGLSIIGSTQHITENPESLLPLPGDLRFLLDKAAAMMPAFASAPLHALWCAARPLAGRIEAKTGGNRELGGEGRSISRDFLAIDHEERDGVGGICTIIGGKATVLRAMAEKAADLVCGALGVEAPCRSAEFVLPSWRDYYRGVRT